MDLRKKMYAKKVIPNITNKMIILSNRVSFFILRSLYLLIIIEYSKSCDDQR